MWGKGRRLRLLSRPAAEVNRRAHAAATVAIEAGGRYPDELCGQRVLLLRPIAEHRIRGALLDYLRPVDPLQRNIRRFQKQSDAAIAELTFVGTHPSLDKIAEKLGVPIKKYLRLSIAVLAANTISVEELPREQRFAG